MGFLSGKKILVTGLLSNRSIAYGVARAAHREGAELAFTYVGDRFRERVADLASEFGSRIVLPLDVASDEQLAALAPSLREHWDGVDGAVHAIAFAPRDAIAGDFLEGLSREGFRQAMDISAYSFPALAKALLPAMKGRRGSMVTLSYLGAVRALPSYNTMGLAKAALEASVRYLSVSMGHHGIRVNAVSAGPIKTLAASGIGGFSKLLKFVETHSPMHRNVSIDEVGNAVGFLLSDLASGISGDILYVDSGFHNVAGGLTADDPPAAG